MRDIQKRRRRSERTAPVKFNVSLNSFIVAVALVTGAVCLFEAMPTPPTATSVLATDTATTLMGNILIVHAAEAGHKWK